MAINPKIKQKAEDIRSKIFGSEVRESLASGLEGMSEDVESIKGRQNTVESTFQSVIEETTGKDVISAPEIIAAHVDSNGTAHPNLKSRLDNFEVSATQQLQQTDLNTMGNTVPLNKGIVLIQTDDGRAYDYQLKELFATYQIPVTTCVNPYRLNNANGFTDYLTVQQLRELQDVYGWEVISHSHNHEDLTALSDPDLDGTLKNSRDWLKANGFHGHEYIAAPYGNHDERVKRFVAKYYKGFRVTTSGKNNITNKMPFDSYQLSVRFISNTITIEQIKADIQRAIDERSVLVFLFHSWEIRDWKKEAFLESVLSEINSKRNAGLIVTENMQGLYTKYGNIVDQTGYVVDSDNQFVIGKNGVVKSNIAKTQLMRTNQVELYTPPGNYPHNKISICQITDPAKGFPTIGTLITYRFSQNENEADNHKFMHQVLYPYNSADVLYRHVKNGLWQDFKPYNTTYLGSGGEDNRNGATLPSVFKAFQVSYHTIGSGNTTGLPTTYGGTLITYKMNNRYSFTWQEYIQAEGSNKWWRTAKSDNEWNDWVNFKPYNAVYIGKGAEDKLNGESKPSAFGNYQVSYHTIGSGNTTGLPTTVGGTLVTYKMDNRYSFTWQEYVQAEGSNKWRRTAKSDTEWNVWQKYAMESV